MRTISLLAFICFISTTTSAQLNKGNWLAGGNLSFSFSKQDEFKTTSIRLSPQAGYFFIDQLAGGIELALESEKQEFDVEDASLTTYLISPFLRYYFLPTTQKVNLFAQAGYGFGAVKYDDGFFDESVNMSGFTISAGPAIFLTPSTSLDIIVGYNSMKLEDESERINTLAFGVGFQVFLGRK